MAAKTARGLWRTSNARSSQARSSADARGSSTDIGAAYGFDPRSRAKAYPLHMVRVALLLAVALLAAGCGAAGKTGTAANTGGATGTRGELFGDDQTVEGQSAAFRAGKIYCGLYPLGELARQEGVKADAEAIAKSYSSAEATAKDKAEARKGCLAALTKSDESN